MSNNNKETIFSVHLKECNAKVLRILCLPQNPTYPQIRHHSTHNSTEVWCNLNPVNTNNIKAFSLIMGVHGL